MVSVTPPEILRAVRIPGTAHTNERTPKLRIAYMDADGFGRVGGRKPC